jgi:tetratricopeptide (TPR) repeat protein
MARPGADWLREGRELERSGSIAAAIERYEAAIAAEQTGDQAVLAEALRRLAVLRHYRGESERARDLCRRSHDVALQIGNHVLAAEALNTLGGLELSTGLLEDARRAFLQALDLGGASRALRARVEQNVGILANIQGELHEALARYERSLEAYRQGGDEHGCAIAYHNMGMVARTGDGSGGGPLFREPRHRRALR